MTMIFKKAYQLTLFLAFPIQKMLKSCLQQPSLEHMDLLHRDKTSNLDPKGIADHYPHQLQLNK